MPDVKTKKEFSENDPAGWVDAYGDKLYGFALARVRDQGVAEDLVQETFLAALKAKETFKGRSSILTWMIGILKHKIVDYFRKYPKEILLEDIDRPDSQIEELFDERGHWKNGPAKWNSNPLKLYEQSEFLKILHTCLENLNKRLAAVFSLREMDGLNSREICKVLNITATNLWVLLYRARAKLRICLEKSGFGLKE